MNKPTKKLLISRKKMVKEDIENGYTRSFPIVRFILSHTKSSTLRKYFHSDDPDIIIQNTDDIKLRSIVNLMIKYMNDDEFEKIVKVKEANKNAKI